MNNILIEENKANIIQDLSETIVSFITNDPIWWLDEKTNINYSTYIGMLPQQQLAMVHHNIDEYVSDVAPSQKNFLDMNYITAKVHDFISTLV